MTAQDDNLNLSDENLRKAGEIVHSAKIQYDKVDEIAMKIKELCGATGLAYIISVGMPVTESADKRLMYARTFYNASQEFILISSTAIAGLLEEKEYLLKLIQSIERLLQDEE